MSSPRRVRLCLDTLEARLAPAQYRLPLVNFGPYIEAGENPNNGPGQVTLAELTQRLQVVAPYTDGFRTFSCTGDLAPAAGLIRGLGKQAVIGAFLGNDASNHQSQLDALVAQAIAGNVDIAVVGNETFLLQPPMPEATLIGYINQVKSRFASANLTIPVTTAQTYDTLLAHPNVIAAVDVVYAHIYPFFQSSTIDLAASDLSRNYRLTRLAAQGKPLILGETGWPSAGTNGPAVPSPQNAARYFLEATSWARANGVTTSYFEAYDEPWKTAEGTFGPHWGLFDSTTLTLKPGMQSVFDGVTTANPFLDFFALPATTRTNLATFVVGGITIPGYTVAVNGVPIPAGGIDGLGAYAQTVPLAPGTNAVTVAIRNAAGGLVRSATKTAVFDAAYSTANLQLLYVDAASPTLDGTVVIDVANNAVLGLLPNQHVRGIAPNGGRVYMDTRAVVSTTSHTTVQTLPFAQPIATNSFLVSPTGDRLYSRNQAFDVTANTIVAAWTTDVTTGSSFNGHPIPGGPAITANGSAIYAGNPVVRIPTNTGVPVPTGIVPPQMFLSDLELSADGTRLIVSAYGGPNGGTVTVFDTATNQMAGPSLTTGDFAGEVRPLAAGTAVVGSAGNPMEGGGKVQLIGLTPPTVTQEVRSMLADNLTTNASRDAVFATSGDRAGVDVFTLGSDGRLTLLKTFVLGIDQYFQGSGLPANDHIRAVVYKPGAAVVPTVAGVAVNCGAAQRSRVTSVTATFDTQVAFAGTVELAFQLTRINGGVVGGFTATVALVNGATAVTLNGFTGAETQFGSLADGRYTLLVRANQVLGLANDYTLTGTVANGLFRLYGDANGDGAVSGGDFGLFRLAFGTTSNDAGFLDYFDFDGNGSISGGDFGNFRLRFGTTVP